MAKLKKEILNQGVKNEKDLISARICPKCGDLTPEPDKETRVNGVFRDKHYTYYHCHSVMCDCQWRILSGYEWDKEMLVGWSGILLILGGVGKVIMEFVNLGINEQFDIGWFLVYVVAIFFGYVFISSANDLY